METAKNHTSQFTRKPNRSHATSRVTHVNPLREVRTHTVFAWRKYRPHADRTLLPVTNR